MGFLRSCSSFCVALGLHCPPGFVGVKTDRYCAVSPDPYRFGQAQFPLACLRYDGSTVHCPADVWSALPLIRRVTHGHLRPGYCPWNSGLEPVPPASGIEDQSLPWGGAHFVVHLNGWEWKASLRAQLRRASCLKGATPLALFPWDLDDRQFPRNESQADCADPRLWSGRRPHLAAPLCAAGDRWAGG